MVSPWFPHHFLISMEWWSFLQFSFAFYPDDFSGKHSHGNSHGGFHLYNWSMVQFPVYQWNTYNYKLVQEPPLFSSTIYLMGWSPWFPLDSPNFSKISFGLIPWTSHPLNLRPSQVRSPGSSELRIFSLGSGRLYAAWFNRKMCKTHLYPLDWSIVSP